MQRRVKSPGAQSKERSGEELGGNSGSIKGEVSMLYDLRRSSSSPSLQKKKLARSLERGKGERAGGNNRPQKEYTQLRAPRHLKRHAAGKTGETRE